MLITLARYFSSPGLEPRDAWVHATAVDRGVLLYLYLDAGPKIHASLLRTTFYKLARCSATNQLRSTRAHDTSKAARHAEALFAAHDMSPARD